jgi:diguanylate cyclase (GGDEF)-like protein
MSESSWLTTQVIQPWLPKKPGLSNHQQLANRFVVSVLLSTLGYTCLLILSCHFLLILEPQGKTLVTHVSAVLASGILLALMIIRFDGNRIAALNVFIATLFIGFVFVSLQTGGINSPVNPCAIAIPALATLSIGGGAGILWAVAVFSSGIFLFIAANYGYVFPSIIAPHNFAVAEFYGLFTAGSLTLYTVIKFDKTSRKLRELLGEEHEKFIELAHHDSLTGLSNRRHFTQHIESTIAKAQYRDSTFCILYFDLNNFKEINDNYGHHSGDVVLREFAKRLRKLNRSTDIIARLGGDEFCMIIPGLSDADVIQKKIAVFYLALAEPLPLGNTLYQISTSIGYAIYPNDGSSYEALIQVADQKMYQEKRQQYAESTA